MDNVSIKQMIMGGTNQEGVNIIFTTESAKLFDGSYHQMSSYLSGGGRILEIESSAICRRTESCKTVGLDTITSEELFEASPELKQEIKMLMTCGKIFFRLSFVSLWFLYNTNGSLFKLKC